MFLKSKFLGVALATCVAVGVSACGGGGMPKCDSSDTKRLLTQIIKEQLVKASVLSLSDVDKFKVDYKNFKTRSTDEKEKSASCECEATMSYDGKTNTETIRFNAQHKDDSLYVKITNW